MPTKIITARVTQPEHDRWRAIASAEGLSMNAWLRRTLNSQCELVEAQAARVEAELLGRERIKSVMEGGAR